MALATDITAGEIQLTGDLAGDGGAQIGSSPQLTHISGLTPGQYINSKVTVDAKGRITAIQTATGGEIGAGLPVATASVKGVVSIGANLNISTGTTSGYQEADFGGLYVGSPIPVTGLDSCATFTVDIQVDGGTVYTVSNTGANLSTMQDVIDEINTDTTGVTASFSSGNLRITSDTLGRASTITISNDNLFRCMAGYVQLDPSVSGTADCELSVPEATTSSMGVVQIGTGIDVTAGVISVDTGTLPVATTTTLGSVIVPVAGNLDIDGSGNISVPIADAVNVGVVSIGSGLAVDGAGELTFDLQIATDTILGGVKEGAGVTIDGTGVISTDFSTLPIATDVVVGTVSVPTSNGMAVDGAGELTFTPTTATDTVLGYVKIPTANGLSVTAGSLDLTLADSTTTFGTIKSANATHIDISSGLIDTGSDVALITATNSYTKAQAVLTDALTSATNVVIDASLSNTFSLTLDTNVTLNNPTNLVVGGTYVFVLTQDATGGRVATYGTAYKFREGVTPNTTVTSNAVDVMSCISDGTNLFCSYNKDFS